MVTAMREMWNGLEADKRDVLAQIMRYAIAGFSITIAIAISYWVVALWLDPNLSLALVFIVFNFVSYVVHGRYSFRGHGGRDNPGTRNVKFFIVNMTGFAVNQFWVWLLVKHLDGPTWWPTIPFVLVTPWLTFALHRKWVYA